MARWSDLILSDVIYTWREAMSPQLHFGIDLFRFKWWFAKNLFHSNTNCKVGIIRGFTIIRKSPVEVAFEWKHKILRQLPSMGPFIVTAAATSIVQRLLVIYTSSMFCRKIPHDFLVLSLSCWLRWLRPGISYQLTPELAAMPAMPTLSHEMPTPNLGKSRCTAKSMNSTCSN